MFTIEQKKTYEAPEACTTDFELECSVLQSSTEDIFSGPDLN